MVLAFIIFISVLSISVLTEALQIKFANYPPLNDKNITESLITQSQDTMEIECARYCAGLDSCESFFYNTVTGECQYHRAVFTIAAGAVDKPGLQYYYIIRECPAEKGFQLLTEEGPCLKFHTDKKSWFDANQACGSYSPHSRLAILDNQQKNDLVKAAGMAIFDQLSSPVYIGLKEYTAGLRWVNGMELGFTDWVDGTVNDGPNEEECACMHRASDFKWSLYNCPNERNYVCEIVLDFNS